MTTNNMLSEFTKIAKRKKVTRNVFLEALVEFLLMHEDKINIIDGKIFLKNVDFK
jgi:hypothetical protein